MSRKFEVEWADFGISVTMELLDEENPEICEAFWQSLPFQTIFAASMSAGEMFKIPIRRALPTAPPEKLRHFPDEPPGSLCLLNVGSLLLKYGTVAEPFMLPRIAMVPQEELEKLRNVATKLRDAYFFTKEINIATFRKKE
jgi:hypothetical protein